MKITKDELLNALNGMSDERRQGFLELSTFASEAEAILFIILTLNPEITQATMIEWGLNKDAATWLDANLFSQMLSLGTD